MYTATSVFVYKVNLDLSFCGREDKNYHFFLFCKKETDLKVTSSQLFSTCLHFEESMAAQNAPLSCALVLNQYKKHGAMKLKFQGKDNRTF